MNNSNISNNNNSNNFQQQEYNACLNSLKSLREAVLANNQSLLHLQNLMVTQNAALQVAYAQLADMKLQQLKNNQTRRRQFCKNKKRYVKYHKKKQNAKK